MLGLGAYLNTMLDGVWEVLYGARGSLFLRRVLR